MSEVSDLLDRTSSLLGREELRYGQFENWLAGGPVGRRPDGTYPLTDGTGFTRYVVSPDAIYGMVVGKYDALFTETKLARKQILDWLSGRRYGGPFADGRFPITLDNGTVTYVACPDRIQMLAVAAVDPAQLDDEVWSQIESARKAAADAVTAVAQVLGMRLTFGEKLPTARTQAEASNGATLISDGARNIGFTIPAGQTGRNTYVRADITLTAKQAAALAGLTLRIRVVALVTQGFLGANTLNTIAGQVMLSDNTFLTNQGGVDRNEQVGNLLYREVLLPITANMRRVGVPIQITGTANGRPDDHSVRLVSTTLIKDTAAGDLVNGADAAFQFRLDERLDPIEAHVAELDQAFFGLGDQMDIVLPVATGASGASAGGFSVTVPAGQTGQYSVLGASGAFDGVSNAGKTLRIRLAYALSAGFTRFNSYTPIVQAGWAGGSGNRAPASFRSDVVGGYRVITMDYPLQGDEIALRPQVQFLVNTAAAQDETATLVGYSLGFITTSSPVLTAADDNLRAFRNSLGNFIHFSTGSSLADASTAQISVANGATLATDASGQRVGWIIPAGQAGNGSQFYAQMSVDGAKNVGNRVRITIPFDVSEPFTRDNLFRVIHVRTNGGYVQRDLAVNRFVNMGPGKRQWIMEYVMQGDELLIRPGMVQSTTAPAAAAEFMKAADFVLEWISSAKPYKTVMDVNLEAALTRLRGQAAADAASLLSGGTALVRTLKPAGGDYASIIAAVNALNNGTAASRYRLKVSDGVYAEAEWRPQDYTDIVGYDRDRAIFDGSLPNNATADQITNTSGMWHEKTSRLEGFTVRMKNGRYALHMESNGLYPNRLLEHVNMVFEHLGNDEAPANTWASQYGAGNGLSSGVEVRGRGTTYKGPHGGFSYHTNLDWLDPSFVDLEDCALVGMSDTAFSMRILPIGSGVADKCRMVGNILVGDFVYGPSPWLPTTLDKQPASHAEVDVWGHGNSPAVFRNIDFGLALSITSANAGPGSSIVVGGSAAPWLFGDGAALKLDTIYTRRGSAGFRARVVGWGDISGVAVGPTSNVAITGLGRRLGDCRAATKTLTVSVDGGAAQNIVCNEDFTAQPNSYVMGYITARLAGAIVGTLPTGQMYRGRFADEEFEPVNSSGAGIARGAVLALNGSPNRVRLMTSNDAPHLFAGFAMFDIEAGKAGRVKKAGHVLVDDILRDDSAAFTFGDTFSVGTPGRMAKGGSQGIFMGIRNNAVQVGGR